MDRIDLIVDRKVVVEIKAVNEIDDAHLATCLSYLKATRLRVGLIINFSREKTREMSPIYWDLTEKTTEKGSEGDRENFLNDADPTPGFWRFKINEYSMKVLMRCDLDICSLPTKSDAA